MRGKEIMVIMWDMHARITPAYAGKSLTLLVQSDIYRDHPRLCGEKLEQTVQSMQAEGSPPPMRGKDFFLPHFISSFRITPAYAGKSGGSLPYLLIF